MKILSKLKDITNAAHNINVKQLGGAEKSTSLNSASDLEIPTSKAIATYVEQAIPAISTNVSVDLANDIKTTSPKAVADYVSIILGDIESILEEI